MTEPIWEEPPTPFTRRHQVWMDALEPLMERPGCWARVRTWDEEKPTAGQNAARSLRNGEYRIPPGEWTFVGAAHNGGSAVWARYDGPGVARAGEA
jgi:hypothetical protein